MDNIQNPYMLVYFKNNINNILQQPLVHTQRIKYTCYEASNSFIILGASSGGLYVFRREPCTFLQIIPNQDGAVENLAISENEKYIAYSTSKRILCVIQFNNSNDEGTARNKNVISNKTIFRDTFPLKITCIKWNLYSTEAYFGDVSGQISVVTIGDFLAKSMFQTPCYPLMKLDSEIVQLDWNSNLILASTLTRCYICDTEREEYRQGGQKLRDGPYGACFVNRNESDTSIVFETNDRKTKKFSPSPFEANTVSTRTYYQNMKIYSARPGARIWEIQLDGTVAKTLQYKEVCSNLTSSEIIPHDNEIESRLEVYIQDNTCWNTIGINFTKLYIIRKHFILTYHKNVMFILDPNTTLVLAAYNSNTDILDIKTIGSTIYLWHDGGLSTIVYLAEIEKFLLRTFINKQYLFCADMCAHYLEYLIRLVPKSNRLYLLSRLCDKILDYKDLLESIEPLLNKIKEDISGRQTTNVISTQGVKLVDNAYVEVNMKTGPELFAKKKELHKSFSEKLSYGTSAFKEQWMKFEEKILTNVMVGEKSPKESAEPHINNPKLLTHEDATELQIKESAEFKSIENLNCADIFDQINNINCDDIFDEISTIQVLPLAIKQATIPVLEVPSIIKELPSKYEDALATIVEASPSTSETSTNTLESKCQTQPSESIVYNQNFPPPEKPTTITVPSAPKPTDPHIDIAYQYFKLSKISKIYNCQALDNILLSYKSINYLFDFTKRLNFHIQKAESVFDDEKSDNSKIKLWCYNIFLRYIELKTQDQENPERKMMNALEDIMKIIDLKKHLIDAFVEMNLSSELACNVCGYPLPSASLFGGSVKYFQIGKTFIKLLYQLYPDYSDDARQNEHEIAFNICKKVPYMWREIINIISEHKLKSELDKNITLLPLLIQYNDIILVEMYMYTFEKSQVYELLDHFVNLHEKSVCLYCKKTPISFNTMCNINWTQMALLLIKVFGARDTLDILTKFAYAIPKGALEPKFYQLCLLSESKEQFDHFTRVGQSNPNLIMKTLENLLVTEFTKIHEPTITNARTRAVIERSKKTDTKK